MDMGKIELLIQQVYKQAKELGVCSLFTGKERTLEEVVHLLSTPQGVEFCIDNHFPNIATFRLFKPYDMEKFGIYIDAGVITLNNPRCAILVGDTTATINCDTLDNHELILLHGAQAVLNASGWAVCKVTVAAGCNVTRKEIDNAIIL